MLQAARPIEQRLVSRGVRGDRCPAINWRGETAFTPLLVLQSSYSIRFKTGSPTTVI